MALLFYVNDCGRSFLSFRLGQVLRRPILFFSAMALLTATHFGFLPVSWLEFQESLVVSYPEEELVCQVQVAWSTFLTMSD